MGVFVIVLQKFLRIFGVSILCIDTYCTNQFFCQFPHFVSFWIALLKKISNYLAGNKEKETNAANLWYCHQLLFRCVFCPQVHFTLALFSHIHLSRVPNCPILYTKEPMDVVNKRLSRLSLSCVFVLFTNIQAHFLSTCIYKKRRKRSPSTLGHKKAQHISHRRFF